MSACPFAAAIDPAHRADPYPFWAALPSHPLRLDDGRWVVGAFDQVDALLHDNRMSSAGAPDDVAHRDAERAANLLGLDPPEHDRLRRIAMRQFGPPHRPRLVHDLEGGIRRTTDALLDTLADRHEADLVSAFAHKLPVITICRLFGIPDRDETRFHDWVATITGDTGSGTGVRSDAAREAGRQIGRFLGGIAEERRGGAGEDFLSGFVNDEGPDGRLPSERVASMATLLLIAGHETTANLIANGILALLRRPAEAARLAAEPGREIGLVEELLRFEPPVQFIANRHALADIDVDGTVIPRGSRVMLVVAAANRDGRRFADPDRFDPGRAENLHLGFGGGVHACFGAPLARLEAQVALRALFTRGRNLRLLAEPPYKGSASLRGPRELRVGWSAMAPA